MEGSNDRGSWVDPYLSTEGEIGDLCNGLVGTLDPTDDTNVTFPDGNKWRVQEQWSNWDDGCALSYGGSGSVSVPISAGWNLLSVATSGILPTFAGLTSSIDANLGAGDVLALVIYSHGRYIAYSPDFSTSTFLPATRGV